MYHICVSLQVAAWGFVAFVLILLAVPATAMLYSLHTEHKQRRTGHEDQLLEALTAMGFADEDHGDDDELAEPWVGGQQMGSGALMISVQSGRLRQTLRWGSLGA